MKNIIALTIFLNLVGATNAFAIFRPDENLISASNSYGFIDWDPKEHQYKYRGLTVSKGIKVEFSFERIFKSGLGQTSYEAIFRCMEQKDTHVLSLNHELLNENGANVDEFMLSCIGMSGFRQHLEDQFGKQAN